MSRQEITVLFLGGDGVSRLDGSDGILDSVSRRFGDVSVFCS